MSKKISTIFLSLFLVGVLSVSCSNKDKTAPDTTTPKTINTKYAGIWSGAGGNVEIDINGNIYEYNSIRGNKGEIIEANDPTYKVQIYNDDVTITFLSDAKSATVITKNGEYPYTKTSQGIELYNGNTYVSTKAFNYENGQSYFWVSVKYGKAAMNAGSDQTSEPSYQGYFPVTGYNTDYSFSLNSDSVVGTFKFNSDGSSVTVRFTKNPDAPAEMLNTDIVCNIKNNN